MHFNIKSLVVSSFFLSSYPNSYQQILEGIPLGSKGGARRKGERERSNDPLIVASVIPLKSAFLRIPRTSDIPWQLIGTFWLDLHLVHIIYCVGSIHIFLTINFQSISNTQSLLNIIRVYCYLITRNLFSSYSFSIYSSSF